MSESFQINGDAVPHGYIRVNSRWAEFTDSFILWPTFFLLLTALLCLPLQILYSWLFVHSRPFRKFLQQHVGTPDMPRVDCPALNSLLYFCQVVLSSIVVCVWWHQSYTHASNRAERGIHDVTNLFFVFHWFYRYLQNAFVFDVCFRLDTIIDAVTVVPEFFSKRPTGIFDPYDTVDWDHRWINMKFLRVLRVAQAFSRLETSLDVSFAAVRILRTVLTTIALILSMAGTVFNVALLGEIPGWEDTYITTGMGDISPIVMFYWMVTTISTVGYGDFAPSTGPTQVLIIGCIFGGCTFFATQISTFVDLLSDESSGKGKYVKRFGASHHIIVVGCGVSKYSCFLAELLDHILQRQDLLSELPDVVLLSETGYDHALREFIKVNLAQEKRNRISLLVGSVMNREDLDRVYMEAAREVYIVFDFSSPDFQKTDGENIIRATHIKDCFQNMPVSLMVMRPQSRQHVSDMKISGLSVISVGQLKAKMFASSCRIKGFMPLIASMLKKPTSEMRDFVLKLLKNAPGREDFSSYVTGLDWSLHAYLVGEAFSGKNSSFQEATAEIWVGSKGNTILFAVLHEGRVWLDWKGSLDCTMVVIGLSRGHAHYHGGLTDISASWEFLQRASFEKFNANLPGDIVITFPELKKFDLEGDNSDQKNTSYIMDPACISDFMLTDPILVVVPTRRIWSQVFTFIRALRQPEFPVIHPILVIFEEMPPQKLCEEFSSAQVHFTAEKLQNLTVRNCHTLVSFCDPSREFLSDISDVYADSETITSVGAIEETLHEGGTEHNAFCIYDFGTTDGLRFIHEHMHKWTREGAQNAPSALSMQNRAAHNDVVLHLEHEASVLASILSHILRAIKPFAVVQSFLFKLLPAFFASRNVRFESDPPQRKLIFQDLFAGGRALTPELFGILFGNCYHAPFTINLVNALCMNESQSKGRQGRYLIQIRCPNDWVGRNFGDLQTAWLQQGDAKVKSCGTLTILAVYRHTLGDKVNGCSVTVPEWSYTLEDTDLLTVLGSKEFGHFAISNGLLRGEVEGSI